MGVRGASYDKLNPQKRSLPQKTPPKKKYQKQSHQKKTERKSKNHYLIRLVEREENSKKKTTKENY